MKARGRGERGEGAEEEESRSSDKNSWTGYLSITLTLSQYLVQDDAGQAHASLGGGRKKVEGREIMIEQARPF